MVFCGFAQTFYLNVEEEEQLHYFTHICNLSPYIKTILTQKAFVFCSDGNHILNTNYIFR